MVSYHVYRYLEFTDPSTNLVYISVQVKYTVSTDHSEPPSDAEARAWLLHVHECSYISHTVIIAYMCLGIQVCSGVSTPHSKWRYNSGGMCSEADCVALEHCIVPASFLELASL